MTDVTRFHYCPYHVTSEGETLWASSNGKTVFAPPKPKKDTEAKPDLIR